jgi:hypothetical protein
MDRGLANAIAGTPPGSVSGIFYRHAWIGMRELKPSSAGGRWGPPRAYACSTSAARKPASSPRPTAHSSTPSKGCAPSSSAHAC